VVSNAFATSAFYVAGIGAVAVFKVNLNVGASLSQCLPHLVSFNIETKTFLIKQFLWK